MAFYSQGSFRHRIWRRTLSW